MCIRDSDLLLASIGQLHLDKSLVEADTLYDMDGERVLAHELLVVAHGDELDRVSMNGSLVVGTLFDEMCIRDSSLASRTSP